LSQEIRLSNSSIHNPWLVGFSLLNADNIDRETFQRSDAPIIVARDQHDRAFEGALFGEATVPIRPHLRFTGGIRAFVADTHNLSDQTEKRSETKLGATPSLTLAWAPSSDRLVWLRYASAIRPGGLNAASPTPKEDFASDQLQNLEIGWRLSLAGNTLSLTGAIFATRWTNLQSDVLSSDGLTQTINAGTANNVGTELSAKWRHKILSIEGGMTIQHARLESSAAVDRSNDRRLPVVPDISGHMRATVHGEVGRLDGSAFVDLRYFGSARLSFDPLLGRSMGNYAALTVGFGIGRDRWRADLGIGNVLDGRGNSFGFGNPFSIRLLDQRTPIQPRTITLRVERSF
jgi:outer membrane receptor protein involved in Fe transport